MKANLRKKQLLPLSRATWSVLHDRHYFHHHRHRPQNRNLHTTENELATQRLPVIHDLTENPHPCQHQISPWPRLKAQKGSLKTQNHFAQQENIIDSKHRFSELSKTSRSSNDPGELNRLSKSVHLHPKISSSERYMCGQSSSFLWRNRSKVSKTSDKSFQVVSRTCLISLSSKPNLEIAERY